MAIQIVFNLLIAVAVVGLSIDNMIIRRKLKEFERRNEPKVARWNTSVATWEDLK